MAIFFIAGRLNIFRQALMEAKKCAVAGPSPKKTAPKGVSMMVVKPRPTPRTGTVRSQVINSAYGRLVRDSPGLRRPVSMI